MNTPAETVTLVDLIDRLVEVPEPAQISMWPQTWAWVVVGFLGAALVSWLALCLIRHYRANAYRRAALAELDAAGDDAVLIAGILRRTALAAFPRRAVCQLAGNDWLGFLESTAEGCSFSGQPGSSIATAPYQQGVNSEGLNSLARKWVRRHKARMSA